MQSLILVLNSGSSSIKFQLFSAESETSLLKGLVENIGSAQVNLCYEQHDQRIEKALGAVSYQQALAEIVPLISVWQNANAKLVVIGHRVVHGGKRFIQPVLINAAVIEQIKLCSELAPLHNPANLLGIEAAEKIFPGIPQVAVFDTAFHQSLPDYAFLYAVPYDYYQQYDVRRYGFHGISYQYLAGKAAEILNKPLAETRFIAAHLGNGCSACAIVGGKSIDTSMGFTPLEGLMMGTRTGDIDPGLFNYLCGKLQLTVAQLTEIFNKKSGLLGVSQLSMDMRLLEQAAMTGNTQAALAIEMFCYRLAKTIAALLVPLGNLDALIFSGGIGENSVLIRKKTLAWLSCLGFAIDESSNANHGATNNARISLANSACALVIRTQEEWMIAQEAMRVYQR